jgi:hypothetical protein
MYGEDEGTEFHYTLNSYAFELQTSRSLWIMCILVCTVGLGAQVKLFVTLSKISHAHMHACMHTHTSLCRIQ